MKIKRGDVFFADLEPVRGSEQGGIRPVLIIQNDIYNKYSPVVVVAAITSKEFSKVYPTNVFLPKQVSKLKLDSTILLNQIRTIDKKRFVRKIGSVDLEIMREVNIALEVSLGLNY